MAQIIALLLLTAHVAVCQNQVRVVWSVDGVAQHQSLQLPLGTVLIFQCQAGSYSNIIYQADRQQYEQCDSAVTNGSYMTIAECDNRTREIQQEVTQNSNQLGTTIHYEPGRTYYFTSYSDGTSLCSAALDVTQGGECLQGLKLAFQVVSNTVNPTTGTVFL